MMITFFSSEVLWFLPVILLLGIITSYTDIREGKIRNRHVVLALIYALIVHFFLAYFSKGGATVGYFVELSIMFGIALCTGFIIWYVGLWTAGDGKLFFAYSTLLPPSIYYHHGHMIYFNFTSILFNTFTPIFIYFFILLMVRTRLRQKLFFLKKALHPLTVLQTGVFLFALTWLIKLLLSVTKVSLSYFLTITFLFIMIMLLEKVLEKVTPSRLRSVYIMLAISMIRLVFDRSVYTFGFVKNFFVLIAVFVFLRFFIIRMSYYFFTKKVSIKLLEAGMVPAEVVYVKDKKYKKRKIIFLSLFGSLKQGVKRKNFLFNPSEPLTIEDVMRLKALVKKFGFKRLRVQQTIPFAPFLLLGVLLTIVVKSDVFVTVASLL